MRAVAVKVVSGAGYGAIGGAASAALTPFIASAVTGGNPNVTSGQAAAIAGLATLTGGVFAGLAGQNAMAGANAAANEAMSNCLGHPESCLQMAKNTASGVWNGLVNVGEVVANIPNGGPFASPGDPGYISLDGLRLPYTPGDQIGPGSAFFTAALIAKGVGGGRSRWGSRDASDVRRESFCIELRADSRRRGSAERV